MPRGVHRGRPTRAGRRHRGERAHHTRQRARTEHWAAEDTRFPEEDTAHFTVTAKQPVRLALKARNPAWALSGVTVTINGEPEALSASRGSYATIDREWKTGDRIVVRLPMTLHTEAMPDNPRMIAVMFGPMVLAGDLGREGLESIKRYGPSAPPVGRVKTPTIPLRCSSATCRR